MDGYGCGTEIFILSLSITTPRHCTEHVTTPIIFLFQQLRSAAIPAAEAGLQTDVGKASSEAPEWLAHLEHDSTSGPHSNNVTK